MFHLAPCSAVQDFDLANHWRYGKPVLLTRRCGSKLKSNATSHAAVWWCGVVIVKARQDRQKLVVDHSSCEPSGTVAAHWRREGQQAMLPTVPPRVLAV